MTEASYSAIEAFFLRLCFWGDGNEIGIRGVHAARKSAASGDAAIGRRKGSCCGQWGKTASP